jgi:hypothetical protein
MAGVAFETNDTGPWGADVWWLLFGSDEQLAGVFPQGATGESSALDYGSLSGKSFRPRQPRYCRSVRACRFLMAVSTLCARFFQKEGDAIE